MEHPADHYGPSIAKELVECMATGRDPTVPELMDLAQRIWIEGAEDRSAFAWGQMATDTSERISALRTAAAALSDSHDDNRSL